MKSGFLTLRPLYDFISQHPKELGPRVEGLEFAAYRRAAKDLCLSVPEEQGFYLWGRFEANGLWRNIYLGKAGFGRTSHVRARIAKELDSERACLWVHAIPNEAIRAVCPTRYLTHYDRAIRKAGSTHIIWVSDPTFPNDLVLQVESDLIETMAPRANLSRPVPPAGPQKHTPEVVAHFRKQIHEARNERFRLRDYFQDVVPRAI
jgi:hypothetical protein